MKSTSKKTIGKKSVAREPRADFSGPAVDAVFGAYPQTDQGKIARLAATDLRYRQDHEGRRRIGRNPEMGTAELSDDEDESGSTIRIDRVKSAAIHRPRKEAGLLRRFAPA
jgi:hypothetical protein